jgi:hypothetical protein
MLSEGEIPWSNSEKSEKTGIPEMRVDMLFADFVDDHRRELAGWRVTDQGQVLCWEKRPMVLG